MVNKHGKNWMLFALGVVLSCCVGLPLRAHAQCGGSQGNNAVWGTCPTLGTKGSAAIIDASVFSGTDICAKIYNVLNSSSYPADGAVIDARGINPTGVACAHNTSPWSKGTSTSYIAKPSYLLLPTGTITIDYTWVLPDKTRVIGQGASATGQTGTVLMAASSFSGPASGYNPVAPVAMVQFGDPSQACEGTGICFNVSIENVTLNGANATSGLAAGILNLDAQELSYAKHVNLYQIPGTGLVINTASYPYQGQNSGPYIDISYNGPSTGTCVSITGAETRGIHGLKCMSSGNTGAAILIDSGANSLEDIHISGFGEGIVLGSLSSTTDRATTRATADTLVNISGSVTSNLIHICKPGVASGACPASSNAFLPQDISILAVNSSAAHAIMDDITGSTLTDPHIGAYMLGESMTTNGGYSRFTSSTSVPTWLVGASNISGSPSCSKNGSLYSSTVSSSTALWVCVAGSWQAVK